MKKLFILFIFYFLSSLPLYAFGVGGQIGGKLVPTSESGMGASFNKFGESINALVDFKFIRLGVGATFAGIDFNSVDVTLDCFFVRISLATIDPDNDIIDNFDFFNSEVYFRFGIGAGCDITINDLSSMGYMARLPFYLGFLFEDVFTIFLQITPAFSFNQMNITGTSVCLGVIKWWY